MSKFKFETRHLELPEDVMVSTRHSTERPGFFGLGLRIPDNPFVMAHTALILRRLAEEIDAEAIVRFRGEK